MKPIVGSTVPGCVTSVSGSTAVVPSLGCLTQVVLNVINLAFTFLGAVAVLFLLYGAIRFVTSRGDPKAIEGAQKTMTYAVIGAVVVVGAFIIINLVTQTFGIPSITNNFTIYQGSTP